MCALGRGEHLPPTHRAYKEEHYPWPATCQGARRDHHNKSGRVSLGSIAAATRVRSPFAKLWHNTPERIYLWRSSSPKRGWRGRRCRRQDCGADPGFLSCSHEKLPNWMSYRSWEMCNSAFLFQVMVTCKTCWSKWPTVSSQKKFQCFFPVSCPDRSSGKLLCDSQHGVFTSVHQN